MNKIIKLTDNNIKFIIVIIFIISILLITKNNNIFKLLKYDKFKNISEPDMKQYIDFVKCNIPYNNSCNKKMDQFYKMDIKGSDILLISPEET